MASSSRTHCFKERPVLAQDRVVAHARQLGESSVRGKALFSDLGARGGVGLARLLHPGADEALEVFLLRHHVFLRSRRDGTLPSNAAGAAVTKELVSAGPGVCPPLPRVGLRWGKTVEVGRGPTPR